ncbi:hypothetical protein FRC04_007305 [Tulasnella sp. 424]|nr:hypothetical protein FRC04_007305 [Tulasnella sp. 424]KAG8976233.1 hypothetical protein FRC05_004483 [Tulasnella sp. 425]
MSPPRANDMADDEEPHRIRKADAAKTITIGVAAISVGLCIPLYFARRSSRASLPSSASLPVAESVSPVRKASPADLLSGKARPARPFSPSSPSSAADIPFNSSAAVEESFNPAFYTFGAFGLATAAVWASAALGVFAVHRFTGASSVSSYDRIRASDPNASQLEDFSLVVRGQIYRALPGLSEKLYGDVEAAPAGSAWSWDDAEKRLEKAYDEGGLYKWATQAQEELNAEASTAQSVATNSR